jgi:hypothetical protein
VAGKYPNFLFHINDFVIQSLNCNSAQHTTSPAASIGKEWNHDIIALVCLKAVENCSDQVQLHAKTTVALAIALRTKPTTPNTSAFI